jgi:hypothetical protein
MDSTKKIRDVSLSELNVREHAALTELIRTTYKLWRDTDSYKGVTFEAFLNMFRQGIRDSLADYKAVAPVSHEPAK